MGKRKERRLQQQQPPSGRRMKLDLSSDDVVLPNHVPTTAPDVVTENPLSLLGQYSDNETDKEEELPEDLSQLSTKSPDQQENSEASHVITEDIPLFTLEIEQNGGEQKTVENDWQAVFDETSGQYYYWNLQTGETSWKMPALSESIKVDNQSAAAAIKPVSIIESSQTAGAVDTHDVQDNKLAASTSSPTKHTETIVSYRDISSECNINVEADKISPAKDWPKNSDGNFLSESNVDMLNKHDGNTCNNGGSETMKISDKDKETVQSIEGLTLEVDRAIEDFRSSQYRDPANVSEPMLVTNVCHEVAAPDIRSMLEKRMALLTEKEEPILQRLKKFAGESLEKLSNHALMAIRTEIQLGVWKSFCELEFVPEACFSLIFSELTKIEAILDEEEMDYIRKSNISQSSTVDASDDPKMANKLVVGISPDGYCDKLGQVHVPASGILDTHDDVETDEIHDGQSRAKYMNSTEVCNYAADEGLADTDMEVDMELDNDVKNEPSVPGIGPDSISVVSANSFPVTISDPLHPAEPQFNSASMNSNAWIPPLPPEEEWAPPLPGDAESIPPPPPEEPPLLPPNSLQLESAYMLGSSVSHVEYYPSDYMTSAAGYVAAPEYSSLTVDASMYGAYVQEVPGAYALNTIPVETGAIVEPYISDPTSTYLHWTPPFPPKPSIYPAVSQKPLPSSSTIAPLPVPSTTSDSSGATANSEAKKASKGKPVKKRTHSVAGAPMLNKKVSSLVSKWKLAKEELHGNEDEDEDDKALYDVEVLERKKQKEIEEWRRQQIASGEALDNANFQPLGAIDWRERVKKAKKSDTTQRDVQEKSVESAKEIEKVGKTEKPILAELSKGLPDDWQAFWDKESGEVYYGNLKTKETSWDRPVA